MGKILEHFEAAKEHLVGGVAAGGRYNPVLQYPLYVARGQGSRFWDIEGKEYIDLFTSSGATFLGHGHPAIREAIIKALDLGILCAMETEYHAQLADVINDAVPCAEKVRLCEAGTMATMGAVRLVRSFTGKSKMLKFEGHFHGMHDYLWYNCSTPLGQLRDDGTVEPIGDSAGMPPEMADLIVVVPFNDIDKFDSAIRKYKDELAGVIMEPISYNQGCLPADRQWLQQVRSICTETGIPLIFDEVLSGFRMCRGGAQEYYGVTPDVCTLAKALGGGVPIAAVCGRADIMAHFNPEGKAIMSGTYTGQLTTVMAALACQREIAKPGFYDHINQLANRLYPGITEVLRVTGVPGIVQGIGARFGIYLGVTEPVTNHRQATTCDRELEKRFLRGCVKRGLYLHDYGHKAPMHHGFSAQHTMADIDQTLNIMEDVFREIKP
jgi:glutamate-1-semialdehyde 2,1-aminomutase